MPAYLGGPSWPDLDATLAAGDLPGAIRLAEDDVRVDPAERQLVIGVCCSMTGQGERAVAALSESLAGDRDLPVLRARAALARSAHLTFDRLGAPAAADTAALLTGLGFPVRARPVRADATASLSGREVQVLEMLREGFSNAEIAARLHNSVRTIEHHVSAILAKLGLRSRAEAAAYAVSLQVQGGS